MLLCLLVVLPAAQAFGFEDVGDFFEDVFSKYRNFITGKTVVGGGSSTSGESGSGLIPTPATIPGSSEPLGPAPPEPPKILDADKDGILDGSDNCKNVPNGPLLGTCSFGPNIGQVCTSFLANNCFAGCEMAQLDNDGDGKGDVCDNCPDDANGPLLGTCVGGATNGQACTSSIEEVCFCSKKQEDEDGDGEGNACDVQFKDTDVDGIGDTRDNCPTTFNPPQLDSDADGLGDVCDPCVFTHNEFDADTYVSDQCGGNDCDDNDPFVNPGMPEVCDDGIDNNCNGEIDEEETCGYYTGSLTGPGNTGGNYLGTQAAGSSVPGKYLGSAPQIGYGPTTVSTGYEGVGEPTTQQPTAGVVVDQQIKNIQHTLQNVIERLIELIRYLKAIAASKEFTESDQKLAITSVVVNAGELLREAQDVLKNIEEDKYSRETDRPSLYLRINKLVKGIESLLDQLEDLESL